MKSHLLIIIILLLLSFPIVRPLINSDYFPMHDDTQIARVVEMGKALRNGQFPVRWVSDLGYGYGYPIFNFYGPLPYYFGGILYALGLSGIVATKVMMIVGMVGAGVSMYIFACKLGGKLVGLFSSIIYIFAPYHAVQLYVRGAIGESWILLFLPFILAGIIYIVKDKKYDVGALFGIIGISGVLLSHTILGFTSVVFYICILGIFSLLYILKKIPVKTIGVLFVTLLFGLALSCFFWLPAFTEMSFTVVSEQIGPTARVFDHFVCLNQFWYSSWGFGGSVPGCIDGLSFSIGKIHILLSILGMIAVGINLKKRKNIIISLLSLGIIIISLYMMVDSSAWIWRIIPGFTFVQYPWRFLVYLNLGIATIAILFIDSLPNIYFKNVVSVIGICSVLLLNSKLFIPQYTYHRDAKVFESDVDIKYRASKISDEYLPSAIERPHDVTEIITSLIPSSPLYTVKNVFDKESIKKIEFISKKELDITLNQAYFPGWKYWVNSKPQPLRLDRGRPIITIPNDFSTLEMEFKNTPARLMGNVISLISVILLGYYYGKKNIG